MFFQAMETISLYLFWTFMLLCASTVLVVIWFGELLPEEFFVRVIGTCFVIGLTNFLLSAPQVVYRFVRK